MSLVFVSHATADREFVEEFVDIVLKGSGLTEAQIFASSLPDMGVEPGKDSLAEVRERVSGAKLVVAVISPTYTTRPVCVAELGAAWGVVGKLHPLLVPGVERNDLDGVLSGMKVDYLDQEVALDELATRIEKETGVRYTKVGSWTRAKQKWLKRVDGLTAALPTPLIVSIDEYRKTMEKLSASQAALVEAEEEIETLEHQVEALKSAKDADDVREILLPADEIERFQILRKEAGDRLRDVPGPVRFAVWCSLSGREMEWPDKFENSYDYQDAKDAVDSGYLEDNDGLLYLVISFPKVEAAVEAVSRLDDELKSDRFGDDFHDWFKDQFDGPPELHRRAVWREVFP